MGSLDRVDAWPSGAPRRLAGWAFDVDAGAAPVQVRLEIDGVVGGAVNAVGTRKDLLAVVGSTDHGYLLEVPALAPGAHTIKVVALDYPTGHATVLGTRSITVGPSAFGAVDVFSMTQGIRGWALDPAMGSAPIQVCLELDGRMLPAVTASGTRNDLVSHFGSADHGFNIARPKVPFGPHTYAVYALGAGGQKTLIGSKTEVALPPVGSLDIATANRIGGWGMDPNSPQAAGRIRIDIDGQAYRTLETAILRGDLASFGPGKYGFEIIPPALGPGTHRVTMYVIDDGSDIAIPLMERTIAVAGSVNRTPIGSVDVLSAGMIGGWVVDPDAQNDAVEVQIRVDGVVAQTLMATSNRPDLAMFLWSGAHGFGLPLPGADGLAAGTHLVEVFALDKQTLAPTLLGKGEITVGAVVS